MVLSIVSAGYGDHSDPAKVVDVTGRLKAAVKADPKTGGTLKVNVGAKAMGNIDPAPGVVKSLKVAYAVADGGEQQEVVVEEGATLELQGEPKPPGPIQVVEAKYGELANPEATIDVTAIALKAAQTHDQDKLVMSADNKVIGRDPAPGKVKQLSIVYSENGQLKHLIVDEGKTAEINPGMDLPGPSTPVAVPVPGANKQAVAGGGGWRSVDGQITCNGKPFFVKGINWSGLETECRQLDGLDQLSARDFLDTLKANGFTAIKIPISTTFGLDLDGAARKETADPDLTGLSAGDVLKKVVAMAGERGLQVVLEMGRIDETQASPELWYDGRHPSEAVMQAWHNVLNATGNNIMGINLKSSCHGRASWGDSNASFDWNKAAEQMANFLIDNRPDWQGLFFVEGVSEAGHVDVDCRSGHASFWGGNLQGVQKHPIGYLHGDGNDRIVYAPRAFGPSVHQQAYFGDGGFPGNMWGVWDEHFGFVKQASGSAVVLAEFGDSQESHEGRMWSDAILEYIKQKGINGGFHSFTTDKGKLEGLAKLQG